MGWGAFGKTRGLWCRPGWQSQGLPWLLPMVCVWGGGAVWIERWRLTCSGQGQWESGLEMLHGAR